MGLRSYLLWIAVYNDEMETVIFTDGSARGNPGPGGWGAIVLTSDTAMELGGREGHTTNNRMELLAVISALENVATHEEITVYTDSAYIVNGITRWVKGWAENKWKTTKKEEVLNKDLWQQLTRATERRVIKWELVKGHAGVGGNERCDAIATEFADNNPLVLYNGSRERYGVDVSGIQTKEAKKSKSKSKTTAYSYVSEINGEIKVHKTWEECKARVHGVAARFKKSVSPADEEEIIREFTE
ncbi:MAG: Ribonuclease H [Parcubacteria group bacterium GW2011_GWF2_39_8b]|nr:MAG: Ribonuclease H [Parcubacteria group bacterium GW2011_GWF2_39_8b]KKR46178.1 MAG: Ribonuclease H [Parcubacteria group bacterium GW2011_GWA2_40_14]